MTQTKTAEKKDGAAQNAGGQQMTGAEMIIQALIDQGVEVVFGYPGGAVLPIYDAIYKSGKIKHILVRHEQGALHAAEGYARSTGKVGVALVTSGPGATNAVTGLTDAMLDSIPVVCFCGQVPTFLIGNDAFQEADTTGITRPCTKHNYLVKDVNKLSGVVHESFHVARSGRPGPVVIDVPKDIQFASGAYKAPKEVSYASYQPQTQPEDARIAAAIEMMCKARRPLFYTGGGVVNAGPAAAGALRALVAETGFPITSTLMGLGAYPMTDDKFLGMLGMHGTYESNLAMHGCDLMICVGARFDDRVTGRTDAFSPHSQKIHIDIDPSSINKNIAVDLPIIADAGQALEALLAGWRARKCQAEPEALAAWWNVINGWRKKDCLRYATTDNKVMKPQYALERLRAHLEKHDDVYITTEVGQHQMWAAQFLRFDEPNRWMTSGGLGTMGYGIPAAVGVQAAHPDAMVVDVAGEASVMMTIQEISTAVQYNLPIKIFILNNHWMGMVRQWQELLHGKRYSESTIDEAMPDFIKLAEAFGGVGLRVETPDELDAAIEEMMKNNKVTIVDVQVDPEENCFPMIPSGKAHNEMILSPDVEKFEQGLV